MHIHFCTKDYFSINSELFNRAIMDMCACFLSRTLHIPSFFVKVGNIFFQYGSKTTEIKQVLSHSKKSCIALYYRQFSTSIKIKIIKFQTLWLLGDNNTGVIFNFNIHRNLYVLQCNKYLSCSF